MNERCVRCQVGQGRNCECREKVPVPTAIMVGCGLVLSVLLVVGLVHGAVRFADQIVAGLKK